jgi:hypothetical protein
VYSEGQNIDRMWPFDIIPRPIPLSEWQRTEAGLKQRLRALNHFIDDIYHEQRIVADGRFQLFDMLVSLSPRPGKEPEVVVLASTASTSRSARPSS